MLNKSTSSQVFEYFGDLHEYVQLKMYVNEKISPTFAKQEDDQKVERDDDRRMFLHKKEHAS